MQFTFSGQVQNASLFCFFTEDSFINQSFMKLELSESRFLDHISTVNNFSQQADNSILFI